MGVRENNMNAAPNAYRLVDINGTIAAAAERGVTITVTRAAPLPVQRAQAQSAATVAGTPVVLL